MSSPETPDPAGILLEKATEDEAAVRELVGNERVSDTVVGFHAQQAVEKLLKAVLANRGVEYPLTHDIAFLVELLEENEVGSPPRATEAIDLTGWAAEFRYADRGDEELDRPEALRLIEEIRHWAEGQVAATPPGDAATPK